MIGLLRIQGILKADPSVEGLEGRRSVKRKIQM